MMKRVCKTRVGVCVMLLAVFLLVGGAGAPVFARQDISNGQAGDPGDGSEISDSGGSSTVVATNESRASAVNDLLKRKIILIPSFTNGIPTFHLVVIANRDVMRR